MSSIFTEEAIGKEIACCRVKRAAKYGFGKHGVGRREVAELVRTLKQKALLSRNDGLVEVSRVLEEMKCLFDDQRILESFADRLFSNESIFANADDDSTSKLVSLSKIEQELDWIFHAPSLEKFQSSLQAEFMDKLGSQVPIRSHSDKIASKAALRRATAHTKTRMVRNGWLQIEGHRSISQDRPEVLTRYFTQDVDEGHLDSTSPEKDSISESLSIKDEFKRVEVVARAVQSRQQPPHF